MVSGFSRFWADAFEGWVSDLEETLRPNLGKSMRSE